MAGNVLVPAPSVGIFGNIWLDFDSFEGSNVSLRGTVALIHQQFITQRFPFKLNVSSNVTKVREAPKRCWK